MKTKTLVLALTLVVLAVAAPTTYVLAQGGPSSSYYGVTGSGFEDEEWWNEMKTYMEQHWEDHEDDEGWDEMKERMEDRWADVDGEDWWDEMKEHMEERWTELEDDGYYRYGRSSSYGGCHG